MIETLLITGSEEAIEEVNLVEFRLLFEGRLPSNGSAPDKHAIRRGFHPQLRELWRTNSSLGQLAESKSVGVLGSAPEQERFANGIMQIGQNWRRAGYNLVPLITSEHVLRCSLEIVLLRPEKQNGLIKNGDIDNKLKTLFDALRMPASCAETGGTDAGPDENPLYVLLEDDALISEVKVTTDRLLMLPNTRHVRSDDAHAIIHVRANHRNPRTFDNYFG